MCKADRKNKQELEKFFQRNLPTADQATITGAICRCCAHCDAWAFSRGLCAFSAPKAKETCSGNSHFSTTKSEPLYLRALVTLKSVREEIEEAA